MARASLVNAFDAVYDQVYDLLRGPSIPYMQLHARDRAFVYPQGHEPDGIYTLPHFDIHYDAEAQTYDFVLEGLERSS